MRSFMLTWNPTQGRPSDVMPGDPRSLAGREGLSLEDAGRRLRYEFLTRVAREIGAGVVATGHTLDDQAETVLMRLLRGSGLEGLAGIPPVRAGSGVRIIRPLIETGRAEVLAYLGAIGTGWREDETNRDVAILRNRVRLVLLPALEGYNPDIRQALARLAGLLRDEAEALKLLAAPKVAEALSARPGAVTVALEPFARMPVALQRRTLRAAVQQVRGNLGAVRFVHIEGARRLALEGQVGSWLALPGGVRILRLPEGAEVTMAAAVPGGPGRPGEYRVHVPGRIVAVDLRSSWVTDSDLRDLAQLPNLATLNLSLTRITDHGMKELKNAPAIADLNLYYAELVTDEIVRARSRCADCAGQAESHRFRCLAGRLAGWWWVYQGSTFIWP